MQKGEEMCRGIFEMVTGLSCMAALVLGTPSTARSGHLHAWSRSMGRTGSLRDPVPGLADTGSCFIMASICNPYCIEGLTESVLGIQARRRRYALVTSWSALDYRCYREDRLLVIFSGLLPPPLPSPSIGLEVVRIKAGPYKALETCSRCIAVTAGPLLNLSLEIEKWPGGGSVPDDATLVSLAWRCGWFELVLGGGWKGECRQGPDMGLSVSLLEEFTLMYGYSCGSDEISSGILYSGRGVLACLGWSSHPVLGETFSLGAGRWW